MLYLDASALVKLVLQERESEALRAWLETEEERTSSALVLTEVPRAVHRMVGDDRDALGTVSDVLASLALIAVDTSVLERAAELLPRMLRSLDAIHLASALSLGQLGTFVTYDDRLHTAARAAGLSVFQPGR